jgi:hypothetical protein
MDLITASPSTPSSPPSPPPPKKILIKSKKVIKVCVKPEKPVTSVTPPADPESAYIQSFTEKERKAYLIAKSHLLSSFSLKKSNGFIQFVSKQDIHEKK